MKIKCIKCGNSVGVRKDIFDKRVEKYGSKEKLLAEYVCRKCKAQLKEGK